MQTYYNTEDGIKRVVEHRGEFFDLDKLERRKRYLIDNLRSHLDDFVSITRILIENKKEIKSVIHRYRRLRKSYIALGQNPKEYDDKIAIITNQLDDIPIYSDESPKSLEYFSLDLNDTKVKLKLKKTFMNLN